LQSTFSSYSATYLSGFTFTSTGSSLTISHASKGIAIYGSVTGVTITSVPVTQDTQVIQSYYDSTISTTSHVPSGVTALTSGLTSNSVLNTTKIPITLEVDIGSFSPVDLTSQSLGKGKLTLPKTFTDSGYTATYINFSDPTANEKIKIQIIAQPAETYIEPYLQNNIVYIVDNPTILPLQYSTGELMKFADVVVEVS
jgi:hypothetical protein